MVPVFTQRPSEYHVSDASPLITAIIPTYRRPRLLRRAVRSVLNQRYPYLRVCVYDDASGDETAEVMAELTGQDSRVVYHCHPQRIGSLPNFAYCFSHVRTPFFSVLSDDDVLLPGLYAAALEGFEQCPEAICSGCLTLFADGRNHSYGQGRIQHLIGAHLRPGVYKPPEAMLAMIDGGEPMWTGMLFRREAVHEVGFDPSAEGPSDSDLVLRVAGLFPIVLSREPGAILFYHDRCVSANNSGTSYSKSFAKIITNIQEDERMPASARAHATRVLTHRFTSRLRNYCVWASLRKHWGEAQEASAVLRTTYGRRLTAFLLDWIRRVCRYFPPARYAGLGLKSLLQFVSRRLLRRTPPQQPAQEDWSEYEKALQL